MAEVLSQLKGYHKLISGLIQMLDKL